MAAEENEEDEESKKVSERQQPVKLSHKQFRRLVKKERRRRKRQETAKKREQKELEEKWRIENDPILRAKLEARERAVKKRLLEEEEENKTQHRLWLEREAIAQERFRKNKEDEERKLREKLEQEERIKTEWEEEQKREKEREERKQRVIKEKESNGAWHNPLAPPSNDVKSYGTEQDIVNCSFYLKTGACRFGERCSRQHPRPNSSVTLMIPAMYNDIRLSQSMLDEADQDTSLEYDEKDAYENYKQFYEDTLPEFRKAGTVVQFKVAVVLFVAIMKPHLRGNVYVQFTREEECAKAFALFNARWYASKQLSCEYSPVTKWKSAASLNETAVHEARTATSCTCTAIPEMTFNHRDDFSPNRTPFNGGRGSERSDRGWRRDQWSSRHRDLDRDRSARDRDWERDRDRRQRERDWSRDRDDDRYRHRRRSKEREHSRTSERREKQRTEIKKKKLQ
ncbi:U2 small nuclear ribonucleoprotein auxiliary factor 35 kDa subunit- protein 2 [Desmophyllum pertusum]|uniref:U2 small nuclear ribonucleoprotein auxiliary factor 35 kDa subunit- protein 2 n=1 Tax=Desmophyllum pertusum TaxID=174260 RepID=A0A9W9YC35_9CNID|nr:U2 small nuclear ribonucleoprotein auxiliary factor 35 kDa subunit- protein 2 [Desmophyllum pertusum]